jgi:hypothetical protein
MDAPRKPNFFKVYFWTVEMFSLALVINFWFLLFSGSIWGTKFRYQYLFDGSLPVIGLQFITAMCCWQQYRRHAILGFAVCLAWLVWAALPRV